MGITVSFYAAGRGDNRRRIISFEELFQRAIDGTSVYPREVVKQALAVNAAAVILATITIWFFELLFRIIHDPRCCGRYPHIYPLPAQLPL